MSIQIRIASEKEYPKIRKHSYEYFIREYSHQNNLDLEEVKKKIKPPSDKRKANDHWYIINYKEKNVGYFRFWTLKGKKMAFGHDIHIYPEYRNKGFAKQAMLKGKLILLEKRFKGIKIAVFKDNYIAINLYEKLGLQMSKEDKNHIEMEMTL